MNEEKERLKEILSGGKNMKRNILDIQGLKVGQAENTAAKTGVTVVIAEKGAVCGVDVRGAAPFLKTPSGKPSFPPHTVCSRNESLPL